MNPNITVEQLLKREPANKGKESGKKGIRVWVNNPITDEKTTIRKEMIEEFFK